MKIESYVKQLGERVVRIESLLDEMRPFFPTVKKNIEVSIKCKCCKRKMPKDWFVYRVTKGTQTIYPVCGICVREKLRGVGITVDGPHKQGLIFFP